jgi:hypothetical protein
MPKYTNNVEGAEKRAPNPSSVLGYSSTKERGLHCWGLMYSFKIYEA